MLRCCLELRFPKVIKVRVTVIDSQQNLHPGQQSSTISSPHALISVFANFGYIQKLDNKTESLNARAFLLVHSNFSNMKKYKRNFKFDLNPNVENQPMIIILTCKFIFS